MNKKRNEKKLQVRIRELITLNFVTYIKKIMNFPKTTALLLMLFMCLNLKADTKTIFVDAFNTLEIDGYFDVTLVQSKSNSVTIEASDKLISFVQIAESSTHLSINFNKKPGPYRHIHIIVAFTQLKEIESKIHGTLRTKGVLNLESLFLDIVSYRPSILELNVRKIDIDATGHGDIQLKGHATKGNINASMHGKLDASKFIVDYLNINASGSGDINVNAKIEASANNTGKGKLKFNGEAQSIDYCPVEFG